MGRFLSSPRSSDGRGKTMPAGKSETSETQRLVWCMPARRRFLSPCLSNSFVRRFRLDSRCSLGSVNSSGNESFHLTYHEEKKILREKKEKMNNGRHVFLSFVSRTIFPFPFFSWNCNSVDRGSGTSGQALRMRSQTTIALVMDDGRDLLSLTSPTRSPPKLSPLS